MPNPPKRKSQQVDFVGFIQISLDENDQTELENGTFDDAAQVDILVKLCKDRYRISFQYDFDEERVKVSAMDVSPDRTSRGYMLTGEADTLGDALMVLAYKHTAKMSGDWRPFCNEARTAKKFR